MQKEGRKSTYTECAVSSTVQTALFVAGVGALSVQCSINAMYSSMCVCIYIYSDY